MKFLTYEKEDLLRCGLKGLLNQPAHCIEAKTHEDAALAFAVVWGNRQDDQDSDRYIYVVPYQLAKAWYQTLPDQITEENVLRASTSYRKYVTKVWQVEEAIDEMDSDLEEEV